MTDSKETITLKNLQEQEELKANYELESFIKALLIKYHWEINEIVEDDSTYPLARKMEEFKINF